MELAYITHKLVNAMCIYCKRVAYFPYVNYKHFPREEGKSPPAAAATRIGY